MVVDLARYRADNADFYGQGSLADVAADLHQRSGAAQAGVSFEDFARQNGFDAQMLQETQPVQPPAARPQAGGLPDGQGGGIWDDVKLLGKVVGQGLYSAAADVLPKTAAEVMRGGDVPLKPEETVAGRTIAEQKKDLERWTLPPEQANRRLLGFKAQDIQESLQSLGYTTGAMFAGGAAGGVAGSVVPGGGNVAGTAIGIAGAALAPGAVAYRASKDKFVEDIRQRMVKANPNLSEAQWSEAKEAIASDAQLYGFWEAAPEAAGSAISWAIGKLPVGKIAQNVPFIKNGVLRAMTSAGVKLGLDIPVELATETWTQHEQGAIEARHGLRDAAPGWLESYEEVAPQTIISTIATQGLLHGGKHFSPSERQARRKAAAVGDEVRSGRFVKLSDEELQKTYIETDALFRERPSIGLRDAMLELNAEQLRRQGEARGFPLNEFLADDEAARTEAARQAEAPQGPTQDQAEAPAAAPQPDRAAELAGLSKSKLNDLAAGLGIAKPGRIKRDELVTAIVAAEDAARAWNDPEAVDARYREAHAAAFPGGQDDFLAGAAPVVEAPQPILQDAFSESQAQAGPDRAVELASLAKSKLNDLAAGLGIVKPGRIKRDELVTAIVAAEDAARAWNDPEAVEARYREAHAAAFPGGQDDFLAGAAPVVEAPQPILQDAVLPGQAPAATAATAPQPNALGEIPLVEAGEKPAATTKPEGVNEAGKKVSESSEPLNEAGKSLNETPTAPAVLPTGEVPLVEVGEQPAAPVEAAAGKQQKPQATAKPEAPAVAPTAATPVASEGGQAAEVAPQQTAKVLSGDAEVDVPVVEHDGFKVVNVAGKGMPPHYAVLTPLAGSDVHQISLASGKTPAEAVAAARRPPEPPHPMNARTREQALQALSREQQNALGKALGLKPGRKSRMGFLEAIADTQELKLRAAYDKVVGEAVKPAAPGRPEPGPVAGQEAAALAGSIQHSPAIEQPNSQNSKRQSKEESALSEEAAEVRRKHLRDLANKVTDGSGQPREVRVTREGLDHVSVKVKDRNGNWVQLPNQNLFTGSKKDIEHHKLWDNDLAREVFQSTHRGQFADLWPARYSVYKAGAVKRPTPHQMGLGKGSPDPWIAIEVDGKRGWTDGHFADLGELPYKENPQDHLLNRHSGPTDFSRILKSVSFSDPALAPRYIQHDAEGSKVVFFVEGEGRLVSAPLRDFSYFVSKYGEDGFTLHQHAVEKPIGVVLSGESVPVGLFAPMKQVPGRVLDEADIQRQMREDSGTEDSGIDPVQGEEVANKAASGTEQNASSVVESRSEKDVASVTSAESEKLGLTLGEKIGGSRKDTATPTGPRVRLPGNDETVPAWRKRFVAVQVSETGFRSGEDKTYWSIADQKGVLRTGRFKFESKEEAEAAVPLAAVSLKHRVGRRGEAWEIYRKVTDRKTVVIKDGFASEEDAKRYMAEHAEDILNTKTGFGEEILARPEKVFRKGAPRREGPAKGQDFLDTFGFRGVEFGEWNDQAERQEVLNHAYDGLLDLAEILNVPPRALSLNSDLALAFGARGRGLSSAKAHYERDYGVINLTKMTGAGSLGHEWFHALDHYLARQDTKASSEKVENKRGDQVFAASTSPGQDFLSHGASRKSQVREELRAAYEKLLADIAYKAEQYREDTEKAEQFVSRARWHLERSLKDIRAGLVQETQWGRKRAPATAEQLTRFDVLAEQLLSGDNLALEMRSNEAPGRSRSRFGSYRSSNDILDGLAAIYKEVRGRSGFNAERTGPFNSLAAHVQDFARRAKMLEEARGQTEKTKQIPTEYRRAAYLMDQGRASDYWSEPHELAARAFAAYIEDKAAQGGGRSDFLVYGANNAMPEFRLLNIRPYPEGAEREAINAAFDDFFRAVKTKETGRGVAMFSRAEPVSGFFSQMQRVLEAPGMLPKSAPAGRMLTAIEKHVGKFKGVELEESGLRGWLAGMGDKAVARQDVLDEIAARRIEIKEVVKSENARPWGFYGTDGSWQSFDTKKEAQEALKNEQDWVRDFATVNEGKEDGSENIEVIGEDVGQIYTAFYDEESEQWKIEDANGYEIDSSSDYSDALDKMHDLAEESRDQWNVDDEVSQRHDDAGEHGTKYEDYQIPGGENYRELLLTLPEGEYQSSHWDEEGVLAHVRFSERTASDGQRVLHVEEIQSDWHQEGKKSGYGDVPNAPFKGTSSWAMLAMKRMIRWAAENGFDRIVWTAGKEQSERYNLGKKVGKLSAVQGEDGGWNLRAFGLDGHPLPGQGEMTNVSEDKLPDIVGRDLAEKIIARSGESSGDGHVYSGLDLKVGGEGMKGFYDQILPREVAKYIKQFGGKVEQTPLPGGYEISQGTNRNEWFVSDFSQGGPNGRDVAGPFASEAAARQALEAYRGPEVWSFDLTDAMRRSALAGQPMYRRADSPPLPASPVARAVAEELRRGAAQFPALRGIVDVYAAEADMPAAMRADIAAAGMSGKFHGAYDAETGRIALVAGNIPSVKAGQAAFVAGLIRHEGRHAFLDRALEGHGGREAYFNRAAQAMPREVAAWLQRYGLESNRANRAEAAEEILVSWAKDGTAHRVLDRLLAKLVEWARAVFPNLKLSKAEMRGLLAQADDFVDGKGLDFFAPGGAGLAVAPAYSRGEARFSRAGDLAGAPSEKRELTSWLKDEATATIRSFLPSVRELTKEAGVLGKLLRSPEYYKHPVLKKLYEIFRDRTDRAHEILHDVFDLGDGKTIPGEARRILKDKRQREILSEGVDYADVNEIGPEAMETWFAEHGASEETVGLWRAMRAGYDKLLDARLESFRALVDKARAGYERQIERRLVAAGVPVEAAREFDAAAYNKDRTLSDELAPYADEVKEVAAAARKAGVTIKGQLADVRLTDENGTTFSFAEMVERMGQLRGFYAPRLREMGEFVVRGERVGADGQMERFRAHKEWRRSAEKLRLEMARDGWTMEPVGKVEKLPEATQGVIKTLELAKTVEAAVNQAGEDVDAALVRDILENLADEVKARGFRSQSIRRSGRHGEVVRGYFKDALERYTRYAGSTAYGLAKAEAARQAAGALFGTAGSPGVDIRKEGDVYRLAVDYLAENLRNAEAGDRVFALAKSVASLKYLGLNPKSALVNLTSMATGVPAALHAYAMDGKGGWARIGREIIRAMADYLGVMTKKWGRLTPEERAFMEDVRRKSEDDPQFARDALSVYRDTAGQAWSWTMGKAMTLFGATEQLNRGSTLLAGYRLARAAGADHATAMERARQAMERAHGVYDRASQPAMAWGTGAGARVAQSWYVYKKYGHNYVQLIHELWADKGDRAAALFALLAPAVLGGVGGHVLMTLAKALATAGGGDDPEKWVYAKVRDLFGGGGEDLARFGLLGLTGADLSGSMNMVDMPDSWGDVLGPMGGLAKDMAQAVGYLAGGQPGRAAEKALPTGLAKVLQAVREHGQGVTTGKNYPVMGEDGQPLKPTVGESIAKGAGFRPLREARARDRASEAMGEERRYGEKRDALYARYRAFVLDGGADAAERDALIEEINAFNADAAGLDGRVAPITRESLTRQADRLAQPTKRERARLGLTTAEPAAERLDAGDFADANHPFQGVRRAYAAAKARHDALLLAGDPSGAASVAAETRLPLLRRLVGDVSKIHEDMSQTRKSHLSPESKARRLELLREREKRAMDRAAAAYEPLNS